MILRIAHLLNTGKVHTVISVFEKCVKIQHLTRSLRKPPAAYPAFAPAAAPLLYPHADQSALITAYLTHFWSALHNLNAPASALCGMPFGIQQHLSAIALTCITLIFPAFLASSSTRRAESARSPESVPVVVDIVFIASVCPVIIIFCYIERVRTLARAPPAAFLKNGIISRCRVRNILRFWSSLISTRNP